MRRTLAGAVVLLALLAACGNETTADTAAPSTPQTSATESAPATGTEAGSGSTTGTEVKVVPILDFTAQTVSGEAFSGASLAGKPVVVWFWAPWCPTCRGQAPNVQALAETYGDTVSFVGVGSLDKSDAIADFATSVPGFPQLTDSDGAVWRHFGVTAQSTYLVLDSSGTTMASGYVSDDKLASLVADLAG